MTDDFDKVLNIVINSLKSLFELKHHIEKEETKGEEGDPKALFAMLLKLEPHILRRMPKQCKEVMEQIAGFAWPEEFAQDVPLYVGNPVNKKGRDAEVY